jgi:hypothetical protein
MTDLITLLSLMVAAFALYAYFRMARMSDKHIAAANKQLDFLKKWRKRYSRRCHTLVDTLVVRDNQIEKLNQRLRKELEDAREREVVLNHFRNKYHAQQDSMAAVAEFFYLHFKPETNRKDDKRFHELKEAILVTLVAQGYEDLRPLLPKKLRNMKSAEENAKNAASLYQLAQGAGQCQPDRVVR